MKKIELQRNMRTIVEMVNETLKSRQPILLQTAKTLVDIRTIAEGGETKPAEGIDDVVEEVVFTGEQIDRVIISCDASIKENPGGPSAVGMVIRFPGNKKKQNVMSLARGTPAKTNNEAEYDAVYEGLMALFNLNNNPGYSVEVRSDSQLVVKQLNGDCKCQQEQLVKRRDAIRNYVKAVPVPVVFVWRPRNSTPDLEQANFLAQDLLGVSRH